VDEYLFRPSSSFELLSILSSWKLPQFQRFQAGIRPIDKPTAMSPSDQALKEIE